MTPEREPALLPTDQKTTDPAQSSAADHIGVCIPTFKRPQLLGKLLSMLGQQKSQGLFRYSVHVIDNDPMRSAETVVLEFARSATPLVTYDVEPVQNIALTRNRAVRCAQGNYVAFIDDDEVPTDTWLLTLYLACREYRADGVLGPVKPLFGPEAPPWLMRSGLCERPSHKSGTILNHLQTRTGNVLFKRNILDGVDVPFAPEKGRTGGEDIEFFRAMIARGCSFAWCEEAPAFEHITPDRCHKRYYLDKALRIGGLTGEMLRKSGRGRWHAAIKSACAVAFYTVAVAIDLLCWNYAYIRHFVTTVYHLGRISACLGFVPVRYRRDS